MKKTFAPRIVALCLPSLLMGGCVGGSSNTSEETDDSRSGVIEDNGDDTDASPDPSDTADAPEEGGEMPADAQKPADAAAAGSVSPCAQTEWALEGRQFLQSLDVSEDGSLYVATETNAGVAQLNHYAATGEPVGTVPIPAEIEEVHASPDGSAFVGRYIESYFIEDDGAQGLESRTYELLRLSPEGDILWSAAFAGQTELQSGDYSGPASYVFEVGRDGAVTVMGTFTGTLTLGEGTENETSLTSPGDGVALLLARYTAEGDLQYATTHGLESGFFPSSMAVGADGSTYAFGVDQTAPCPIAQVAAFAPDGELRWLNRSDACDPELLSDYPRSRTFVAPDGSVVVTGVFTGPITFPDRDGSGVTIAAAEVPTTDGSWAIIAASFVVRYDAEGHLLLVEGGKDSTRFPPCPETNNFCEAADILLIGDELVSVGNLDGGRVFDTGDGDQISLSGWQAGGFIARNELDGTLISANYLDLPFDVGGMWLVGAPDSLLGVSHSTPSNSETLETVTKFCLE